MENYFFTNLAFFVILLLVIFPFCFFFFFNSKLNRHERKKTDVDFKSLDDLEEAENSEKN